MITGLLTKAGNAKNATEHANLEEEVQLALVENEADKYLSSNSSIENKLKAIFEKSYGEGNITVAKSGKNYKVKVKDSKTTYRIRYDGKVEKYEEMDPTNVYARLDDEGTLYLKSIQDTGYNLYTSSASIKSNWNTAGNATKASVLKVEIEEPIAPTSGENMFLEYTNLKNIEKIKNLHTENMVSMYQMFRKCESIEYLDLSSFDTKQVINYGGIFAYCTNLKKVDISSFDTSNAIYFNSFFANCNKLEKIDVSNFNTENVTTMYNMFAGCTIITELDLKGFDTRKVNDMRYMFYLCNSLKNLDLRAFNTQKVTKTTEMFRQCKNLETLDISNFSTEKIDDANQMFYCDDKLKKLNLGKSFIIGENLNIFYRMLAGSPSNIIITTIQETANKIKEIHTNLTDNNFEIIE